MDLGSPHDAAAGEIPYFFHSAAIYRGLPRVVHCAGMYIFGHIGLTAAAARAVDEKTDLRLAILLSILPDLIDKPASVLLPALYNGGSRGFGHTLLVASLLLAALLARRRRVGGALILWACYAGHLLLDRMWLNEGPRVVLWPFLGDFPDFSHRRQAEPHIMAYYLAGETLGLALALGFARRHGLLSRPRLIAFARTGRLAASPPDAGPAGADSGPDPRPQLSGRPK